jgi:Zn-dependent metalloprotease
MKRNIVCFVCLLVAVSLFASSPKAISPDAKAKLDRTNAMIELRKADSKVELQFDKVTDCVTAIDGKLSQPSNDAPLDIAFNFLNKYRALFNIQNPSQEFALFQELPDDLGMKHYKFNQLWHGVPVWTAQLTVHLRQNGAIYYVGGNYYPSPNIDTNPAISENDAISSATSDYLNNGGSAVRKTDPKLMIYTADGRDFKLAWYVKIIGTKMSDGWEYFVDAKNGAILYKVTTIRPDGPVTGTGTDSNGSTRSTRA